MGVRPEEIQGTSQDPTEGVFEPHIGAQRMDMGSAQHPIPLKKLYDVLEKIEGSEMEFKVERATKDDGLTFSEEAFDYLHQEVWLWIGSRVSRACEELPGLPQQVSVVVTVEVTCSDGRDDG